MNTKQVDLPVSTESVLMIKQLDHSLVTRHVIATELNKCPDLIQLRSHIVNDWPRQVMQNLCPFWQVKHELSVEGDIIFRGLRVFILPIKAFLQLRL